MFNSNNLNNDLKSLFPRLLISAGKQLQSNLANHQPKSYGYTNNQQYQNNYSQPASYSYQQPVQRPQSPTNNNNYGNQYNQRQQRPYQMNNRQPYQNNSPRYSNNYGSRPRRPRQRLMRTNAILKSITGQAQCDLNELAKSIYSRGGDFNTVAKALSVTSKNSGQPLNETTINNIANENIKYQSSKVRWLVSNILKPTLLGIRTNKMPFRALITLGLQALFITHGDINLSIGILKLANDISFNGSVDVKAVIKIALKYHKNNKK